MSLPTFAAQSNYYLLQRLLLGVCAVADTNEDRRTIAAVAIADVFFCNEGGCVADGEAREGAHH